MGRLQQFTESDLKKRLQAAKARGSGKEQLNVAIHFARLATTEVPESPYAMLVGLPTWPCYLYGGVGTATREETLRWLIANAGKLSFPESFLEKGHHWLEQWHLELLRFVMPSSTELAKIAKAFESRKLSPHSKRLYARLRDLDQSTAITLSWLRHLTNAEEWSDVIEFASDALPETTESGERAKIYLILIDAFLQRGWSSKTDLSDGERALHLLFEVRREGLWKKEFDDLLERAGEAALPADLKIGRGKPTSLLADVYRGFGRAGKWFGKSLGGRDAQVPYSKGVVESAPAVLASGVVEEFLSASEKHLDEFRNAMKSKGGDAEAIAVAGAFSIGGFWTLAQIDDTVLAAMTFSSAGNPESFWRLREIADTANDSQGAVIRFSGYVAEQQVAVDLAREGHVVEFPDGPAEPGYDLLVDGHPVQVKCSMDADYVMDHLNRYPDIPAVVNAELAEQFSDHPMVWVDSSLSHAEVASTTEESLNELAGFADAEDMLPIPFLSVAFAAVRNFDDLDAGRIYGGKFAKRVAVDAAARTVGGGAGSFIGGAVGSFLGPVGTVIGASLGGFIGSVASGTGADAINRDQLCDARDAVVARLGGFAAWFRETSLRARITMLEERYRAVSDWAHESTNGVAPKCVATFFTATKEMLDRAKALESWLAERQGGDDFARVHAGWVALREARAFFHPELKNRLAHVQEAMRSYTQVANPGTEGLPSPAGA